MCLALTGCAESKSPGEGDGVHAAGSSGAAGMAGASGGGGGVAGMPAGGAGQHDASDASPGVEDGGAADAMALDAATDVATDAGPALACDQYGSPSGPVYVAEACLTSYKGPCPQVALDQQGQPFNVEAADATLEDVRCLLRALRDRTPGYLWFVTEYAPGLGIDVIGETRYGYHVLADGTAISAYDRWYDLMSMQSWSHVTPKPAEFFDACLELSFGHELFNCLTQWTAVGTPSTCPLCEEVTDASL